MKHFDEVIKRKIQSKKEIMKVSDFLGKVEEVRKMQDEADNHADLLFRGQRKDDPLLPKIARMDLGNEIRNREKLMIDEFRRTFRPFVEFPPTDDWDILAIGQHHGLPTRLLDWTHNALAALWFTVEKDPLKDNKGQELEGVVWVFSPTVNDYRKHKTNESPFDVKASKIFRPNAVTRRLLAQSGVFTVHAILESNTVIPFNTHKNYVEKLQKIVVKPYNFHSLRKELDALGVNSASMFPDLDGLCQHLGWRYCQR